MKQVILKIACFFMRIVAYLKIQRGMDCLSEITICQVNMIALKLI